MALWISNRQRNLLSKRYTKSSETYNRYLTSHYHLRRRCRAAVEKAITCFRKAVETDSEYARAFAGLAASYTLLSMPAPVDPTMGLEALTTLVKQKPHQSWEAEPCTCWEPRRRLSGVPQNAQFFARI